MEQNNSTILGVVDYLLAMAKSHYDRSMDIRVPSDDMLFHKGAYSGIIESVAEIKRVYGISSDPFSVQTQGHQLP